MLDDDYAVGELRIPLHGWSAERRFVVIREQVRAWPRQRRPQADRCARLYLPRLCHQLRRSSGGDLAGLQSARRHGTPHRRIAARPGRRGLPQFFAAEAAFRAVLLQNPPAVLFSAEREMRIPLPDSILNWQMPTSPKLNPALVTDPEPEP